MYLEPEAANDVSDLITVWETNCDAAGVATSAAEMETRNTVSLQNGNRLGSSLVILPELCLISSKRSSLAKHPLQFCNRQAHPDSSKAAPLHAKSSQHPDALDLRDLQRVLKRPPTGPYADSPQVRSPRAARSAGNANLRTAKTGAKAATPRSKKALRVQQRSQRSQSQQVMQRRLILMNTAL